MPEKTGRAGNDGRREPPLRPVSRGTLLEGVAVGRQCLNSGAFAGQSAQECAGATGRRATSWPGDAIRRIRRPCSRSPYRPRAYNLVARSDRSTDPGHRDRGAWQRLPPASDGWLGADTCARIRPILGSVLGFGRPQPRQQLIASASGWPRRLDAITGPHGMIGTVDVEFFGDPSVACPRVDHVDQHVALGVAAAHDLRPFEEKRTPLAGTSSPWTNFSLMRIGPIWRQASEISKPLRRPRSNPRIRFIQAL